MRASSSPMRGVRKRGRVKSAGRQLHPGQPRRAFAEHDRRQVVARARIEQGVVGDRAGGDDARHFAPHEALGLPGVFDLVADRHAQAGGDQLAQVAFELMVGKARHRRRVFALVAAGERQAQHAGGRLGVFEKHLVEVAHAKQQQRIGTRRLGVLVLLHHGRGDHSRTPCVGSRNANKRPKGRGGERAVRTARVEGGAAAKMPCQGRLSSRSPRDSPLEPSLDFRDDLGAGWADCRQPRQDPTCHRFVQDRKRSLHIEGWASARGPMRLSADVRRPAKPTGLGCLPSVRIRTPATQRVIDGRASRLFALWRQFGTVLELQIGPGLPELRVGQRQRTRARLTRVRRR